MEKQKQKQEQELRAYFFQNMYLQGIHAGIQSQHTTSEMFVKYKELSEYCDCWHDCSCHDLAYTLHEWAKDHKTTIVLNGGMQGDLEEVIRVFDNKVNPHPWAFFKESEYALGGALTNVGIILPEKIYNAPNPSLDIPLFEEYCDLNRVTEYEKQIIGLVKSKRLF